MDLAISAQRRVKFWWEALRLTWGVPVLIVGAIWGILSGIRDELFSEAMQANYRLSSILPSWSLTTWALLGLLMLLVIILEAGYRIGEKRQSECDALKNKLDEVNRIKLRVSLREGDTRYFYSENNKEFVNIYLHNDNGPTISGIEAYSNGVVPFITGTNQRSTLTIRPRASPSPLSLSSGQDVPIEILCREREHIEGIRHMGGQVLSQQGHEFLMKLA